MTTTGDVVARMHELAPSRVMRGICVSLDWPGGTALVNFGGANVTMPMVGTPPIPNQECLVALWAGIPVCLGLPARPSLGVVAAAPSGGRITITGDDGVAYSAVYDPNVTGWTVGQRVLLDWPGGIGGGPTVVLKLSADPAPPPPPDQPAPAPPPVVKPPKPKTRDLYFTATWSGTQNGSGTTGNGNWWTTQVYAGTTTIGAWGYGRSIATTIPDGATINLVRIFLAGSNRYAGPNLGLHSLPARAGAIVVRSAVAVPLGLGWKTLPNGFGDQLKTGAARGIATAHGGYSIFNPAGVGSSGRLHIRATW